MPKLTEHSTIEDFKMEDPLPLQAEAESQSEPAWVSGWRNNARLHTSTFEYLKPTDKQIADMALARAAAAEYADLLGVMLPDGPDKTYCLRKLREIAMWANVAITRLADGTPRG